MLVCLLVTRLSFPYPVPFLLPLFLLGYMGAMYECHEAKLHCTALSSTQRRESRMHNRMMMSRVLPPPVPVSIASSGSSPTSMYPPNFAPPRTMYAHGGRLTPPPCCCRNRRHGCATGFVRGWPRHVCLDLRERGRHTSRGTQWTTVPAGFEVLGRSMVYGGSSAVTYVDGTK